MIRKIWNRIAKRKYTRALEAEVARLRGENRALLNSILGIAGIPPIVVSSLDPVGDSTVDAASKEAGAAPAVQQRSAGSSGYGGRANGSALRKRPIGGPTAVRHRSWQQVNRTLEFDAMRKREQGSAEPPRAARQT